LLKVGVAEEDDEEEMALVARGKFTGLTILDWAGGKFTTKTVPPPN